MLYSLFSLTMVATVEHHPVPLWIDNKPVKSGTTFPVINNGNGNTTSAYGATPEIVKDAIRSSHLAFASWRKTTPWERRDLLLNAARLLAEQSDVARAILEVRKEPPRFLRVLG